MKAMASWTSLRSAILVILVENSARKQEGTREFFEPPFLRTARHLRAQKGAWLMGE